MEAAVPLIAARTAVQILPVLVAIVEQIASVNLVNVNVS